MANGNIFGGLNALFETLTSKMGDIDKLTEDIDKLTGDNPSAQTDRNGMSMKTGSFNLGGDGDDKPQVMWGFNFRSLNDGSAKVEQFGNVKPSKEGPVVAEVREPLVDTFDETDEIVIVAELPGVDVTEISVHINEDILEIATTGKRKYAREILLSSPVDEASLELVFRNGILELKVKKSS